MGYIIVKLVLKYFNYIFKVNSSYTKFRKNKNLYYLLVREVYISLNNIVILINYSSLK